MNYRDIKIESVKPMVGFLRAALVGPEVIAELKQMGGPVKAFAMTDSGLIGATLNLPNGTRTRKIGQAGRYQLQAGAPTDHTQPFGLALRFIAQAARGEAGYTHGVTGRMEFGAADPQSGVAVSKLVHLIGPEADHMETQNHILGVNKHYVRQDGGWARVA